MTAGRDVAPVKDFFGTLLPDYKTDFEHARDLINNNLYQEALPILQKLLKEDPQSCNLNFLVGYCYYNIETERNKALPFLEKAISSTVAEYDDNSSKERSAPVYSFFYLGKCYHWVGRLEAALTNLEKFRAYLVNKSDQLINTRNLEIFNEVNASISQVKLAQKLSASPLRIEFVKIPFVNTQNYACYGAQLTRDGSTLYYSRERLNDKIRGKSDMYVLKKSGQNWVKNEQTGQNLNGPYNDIFNSISSDGKFLLFSSDRKGDFNVYYSINENNKWSEPLDNLSINSASNESYAVLSHDGNRIFFVSNRPGGFGGKDIYKIEKKPDGSWTQAENLGFTVNTSGDEDTPWLSGDGNTLYYSSTGHSTMGGADIFYSEYKNSMWMEAVNMGYPVNSVANDHSFKYYPDNNLILFSSNRKTGGLAYEIMGARYLDSTRVNEMFKPAREGAPEDTVIEIQTRRDEKPLLVQLSKDTLAEVMPQVKKEQPVVAPAASVKETQARQDSLLKLRNKWVSDSLAAARIAAVKKEKKTGQDQNVSIKAQLTQDSINKAKEQERKAALAKATQEKLRQLREKKRNDSLVNAKRIEDSLKIASAKLAARQKFQQGQQQAELAKKDTSAGGVTIVASDSLKTIRETIALQQKINDSITRVKRQQDSLQLALTQETARLQREAEQKERAVIVQQKLARDNQIRDSLVAVDEKGRLDSLLAVKEMKYQDSLMVTRQKNLRDSLIAAKDKHERDSLLFAKVAQKEETAVTGRTLDKPGDIAVTSENKQESSERIRDTLKRYTVQVGAGWMKIKYFKSIAQKKICYGPDGMARFIVGAYSKREEAEKAAEQLRSLGFTDAWVPPVDEKRCIYSDNQLITQGHAERIAEASSAGAPAIQYTVQVGAGNMKIRYFKALQQVNACTGTDGLTRFTYGIFNTLGEAVRVRNTIMKLGFRDAWTPPVDENRCGNARSVTGIK